MTVRHWIAKSGGTLEAYVTVPLLLPYLDTDLLMQLSALDELERFLQNSDAGERILSEAATHE